MKVYLTYLSPFLLFFLYIFVSLFLFFWCCVSPTVNSTFFLSFFLSFCVHLRIISGSLVFFVVSQRTKQSGYSYLFSGDILISPYELAWEDSLCFASQTRLPVRGFLGQLTYLIFPLYRFDLPAASYHVGFLANWHSAFKQVACCLELLVSSYTHIREI